jgi:hypothetical protein
MSKGRWTAVSVLVLVAVLAAASAGHAMRSGSKMAKGRVAAASRGYAIRDTEVRKPHLPRLDVWMPHDVPLETWAAPLLWRPSAEDLIRAVNTGRAEARAGRPASEVLRPWRLVLDQGGEYATFLTPLAVATVVGWQAEKGSWPKGRLAQTLTEALASFGSGVCVCVELRSYTQEAAARFGVDYPGPADPGEAYEATFLLGPAGSEREGRTSVLNPDRFGEVHINRAHQYCQVLGCGECFGVNYYVWWPFVDEEGRPAFVAPWDSLQLTVITPTRKREYRCRFNLDGQLRPDWTERSESR